MRDPKRLSSAGSDAPEALRAMIRAARSELPDGERLDRLAVLVGPAIGGGPSGGGSPGTSGSPGTLEGGGAAGGAATVGKAAGGATGMGKAAGAAVAVKAIAGGAGAAGGTATIAGGVAATVKTGLVVLALVGASAGAAVEGYRALRPTAVSVAPAPGPLVAPSRSPVAGAPGRLGASSAIAPPDVSPPRSASPAASPPAATSLEAARVAGMPAPSIAPPARIGSLASSFAREPVRASPAASASQGASVASAASSASVAPAAETEVGLLQAAQDAVRARPADALALAERHAARFPSGTLVQEREVIAIDALVRLGQRDRARERAERFGRAFPMSAYRPRIEAILGSGNDAPVHNP